MTGGDGSGVTGGIGGIDIPPPPGELGGKVGPPPPLGGFLPGSQEYFAFFA